MKFFSSIISLILISLVLTTCQKQNDTDDEIILNPPTLSEAIETYKTGKFQEGFTLLAPLTSKNTYLIDMEGYVVHYWTSDYTPNNSVYLLEDGSLLRTEKTGDNDVFSGDREHGGRIAKYNFEGSLVWAWNYSSSDFSQHHDIELLPNGNILVIAWELKTSTEANEAGRITEYIDPKGVWPEHVIEVRPIGNSGGEIVWEWHQWQHMIQDIDTTKNNFGNVADHPELIDINYSQNIVIDISHINGINYIEEHDLIVLSAHHYNELWIIDHSTTTSESASHTGGNRGKGGDLLYRWGNPLAYKSGSELDQMSFLQHNPVWLETQPSNGGNLLFFNNGDTKKNRDFSTVDEILLPIDSNGDFNLLPNVVNGPNTVEWRFEQEDFYSRAISGAQRLNNGNTLICEGLKGLLHEVTINNETVWKYNLPLHNKSIFRANRYPKDYPAFSGKTMERLNVEVE